MWPVTKPTGTQVIENVLPPQSRVSALSDDLRQDSREPPGGHYLGVPEEQRLKVRIQGMLLKNT